MSDQRSRVVAIISVLTLLAGSSAAVELPFTMHVVTETMDGARAVRAADIDGDGDLDLIAAASIGHEFRWIENLAGDGSTWTDHVVSDSWTFNGANSVGAADIDGDGDLDIFGSSGTAGNVWWFENDGTPASGSWPSHIVESSLDSPNWVDAGDLDGDGDPDLVGAILTENTIRWWENDDPTTGGWTAYDLITVYDAPWSAVMTDLDGDGDLDILTSAITENMIAWWENDGTPQDGGWLPRVVTNTFNSAHGAFPADFDGDGDLDIVGVSLSDDLVTWWESDGTPADGGWTEHNVDDSFDLAYDVSAADMDGDGDPDILGAAAFDDEITWWENDGTPADGGWIEHTVNSAFDSASSVGAADVDGDGDLDIIGAARFDDKIAWWENDTIHRSADFPSAAESVIDPVFSGEWPISLDVADLDLDGDLDVVMVAPDDNDVVWWESDGTPEDGGWTKHSVTGGAASGVTSVVAHDIDQDGDSDVAVAFSATSLKWWENDGSPADGGWVEHGATTQSIVGTAIQACDITGNGHPDLVLRHLDTCTVVENDGTPATGDWIVHAISWPYFDSQPGVADIDRDGRLDVVSAGETVAGEGVYWYENIGQTHPVVPNFEWNIYFVADVEAFSVALLDIDRDGDVDILLLMANSVTWWENDGTPLDGGWAEHLVGTHLGAAKGVIHGSDLDLDGDLDVIVTASQANDLIWWESDGTPLDGGWTQHVVDDDFAGVMSVVPADLDADGDLDLVAAAENANQLVWWQNRGGQFTLETADSAPSFLVDGQSAEVLEIEMTHRGRPGDHDEELVTFELLFESEAGIPLSSAQANAIVNDLSIYLDDGDGVWTEGTDTLFKTTSTLNLVGGVQTLIFTDGSGDVRLSEGSSKRFFVIIGATSDASMQNPNTLKVTHLTDARVTADVSAAEDQAHDIPLKMEWSGNVASTTIAFYSVELIFADGFESGNTDRWSASTQ